MNQILSRVLAVKSLVVLAAGVIITASSGFASAEDGWGTLKGQVVVTGVVPEIPDEPIGNSPERTLCLVDGKVPKDDNIVVDDKGGLRDVYVMMYVKGKGEDAPIHEMHLGDQAAQKISIDNVKCRFVPHALFVKTGQSVLLKNSDSVGHNCHITTFNNEHNVNLPAGDDVEITLEKSDKVPGQVKCDIHRWMDGVVLVRDNPYVAITDANGKFEIKNVPAGEWEFQFWHNKAGYMKKLESGSYKFGRKGETEVAIAADQELDIGRLEFPATSFK